MSQENPAIELHNRREAMRAYQDSLVKGEYVEPSKIKISKEALKKGIESGKFSIFEKDALGKLKEDFQANAIKKGFSSEEIQKGENYFNSMVCIEVEGNVLFAAAAPERVSKKKQNFNKWVL